MKDQNQLQESFTMTIDGLTNCYDITYGGFRNGGSPASTLVNPGGFYELSYTSDVKYHDGSLPMNKVVVYNTTNSDPNGWFYVIDSTPKMIRMGTNGTESNTLFAFLIDITGQDNTGTGTLSITQLG
jgi:hypothetical protein